MFNKQVATPVADKTKKISFYPESYNEYIGQDNMEKVSSTVKILLHDDNTILPMCATSGPIGYNLHSPETVKIPLRISLECPMGMYPRIADRRSMASKGIIIRGGVIDNDYRGNLIVCLHNNSDEPHHVKKEQRIVQLILRKMEHLVSNE